MWVLLLDDTMLGCVRTPETDSLNFYESFLEFSCTFINLYNAYPMTPATRMYFKLPRFKSFDSSVAVSVRVLNRIFSNIQRLELRRDPAWLFFFWIYFFSGPECVGHSLAYVAHFVFLRDVCSKGVLTQLSHPSPYLATHLPDLATLSLLSHPSPYFATHLLTNTKKRWALNISCSFNSRLIYWCISMYKSEQIGVYKRVSIELKSPGIKRQTNGRTFTSSFRWWALRYSLPISI